MSTEASHAYIPAPVSPIISMNSWLGGMSSSNVFFSVGVLAEWCHIDVLVNNGRYGLAFCSCNGTKTGTISGSKWRSARI